MLFIHAGIEIYVPTITSACVDRSNGMHRLNIQWKVSIHNCVHLCLCAYGSYKRAKSYSYKMEHVFEKRRETCGHADIATE